MDVQGDLGASLSSLSGDLACIMSRYRISKDRAADARAKRFLEETFSHIGAGRLGCDHGCPGADTLVFSADFRDWCFNLAGTVDSGVGAQVLCLNRVSPVIHFSGTYAVPPHKTMPTTWVRPDLSVTNQPDWKSGASEGCSGLIV